MWTQSKAMYRLAFTHEKQGCLHGAWGNQLTLTMAFAGDNRCHDFGFSRKEKAMFQAVLRIKSLNGFCLFLFEGTFISFFKDIKS